jgi:hypothetical protein
MGGAMRRSRTAELDAEKAAELNGERRKDSEGVRRREELEADGKRVRFELEGEMGSIRKAVNVVVRSERVPVASGESSNVIGLKNPVEAKVESSVPRNAGAKVAGKAVPVNRDLPPLPMDQGKPGCRNDKESASDCERMRETCERERWKAHNSVGPDGSYNYR